MGAALASSALEPREARLLLAHVLGCSEATVLAFPEREIDGSAVRRFSGLVVRRRGGEPVAYLTGAKEFYGLELEVSPTVLIPRPETELLVDLALERCFSSVADLGTGSGAVALALKHKRSHARVVGVEASAEALEVARRNGARLGLAVEWREGHWYAALAGERYDLLVSNPPYVAERDPHLAALAYEPRQALVAGADGLDALRDIATGAYTHLNDAGWLLVEHGLGQDAAVRALLREGGLEEVQTWPDLAGIPRVSGGRR